jgi:hypothetical protein
MDIPITLPLDSDGFLRRECPKCEREFKWHEGPTEDRPQDWNDPPVYWCPLCGSRSDDMPAASTALGPAHEARRRLSLGERLLAARP